MISCNVIKDLMPAYLDGVCTDDSRSLIEDHLLTCDRCRNYVDVLGFDSETVACEFEREESVFLDFAAKVQKRRTCMAFIIVAVVAVATVLLTMAASAGIHFKHSMTPTVYDVEEGVFNLTASNLVSSENDVSKFVLYTNFAQISITVNGEDDFDGTVMLYNADYPEEFIMVSDVNEKNNDVLFTGLNSAYRYFVEYEGTENVEIIISEGRGTSFWNSLKSVISDIFTL